jgi:peptide/nickel transport system permease protein
LIHELLPTRVGPNILAASLQVAIAILADSCFAYLGYSIPPPQAGCSFMLNNARNSFTRAPWLAVCTGMAMTAAVLAINVDGAGLHNACDPRQRVR